MSPTAIPSDDPDYGLELAVRRRRTKSLLDADQLRRNIVITFNYGDRYSLANSKPSSPRLSLEQPTPLLSNRSSQENLLSHEINPLLITSEQIVPHGVQTFEDWEGNEIHLPRDADRILEQFVVMLSRISAFMKTGKSDPVKLFGSSSVLPVNSLDLPTAALHSNTETETPLLVGDSRPVRNSASYLHEYPQIFNKKPAQSQMKTSSDSSENNTLRIASTETKIERPLRRKITVPDKIDELSEHQFEDRQTSAIRSGEISESHSKLSNEKVEVERATATDEREPSNVDSLQSIINRMKTSLHPNTDSNLPRNQSEGHTAQERPSSSRDLDHTEELNDEEQDKKNR